MTNAITKEEYAKIKNDCNYLIISFDKETGERKSSYSGCAITRAVEEHTKNILNGLDSLILYRFNDRKIMFDIPRSEQTREKYIELYLAEKKEYQCQKCYSKHYCKNYQLKDKDFDCEDERPIEKDQ